MVNLRLALRTLFKTPFRRLAQSLLFELAAHDPMVLAISVVLLALVALAAGFVPAQRASKIDPIRALRYE